MSLKIKNDRLSFAPSLSVCVPKRLGEEELLRQFSERLRMHFSYVLSEPLPGDIIRLLDKLGENNR